jgi:heat shock protein HslJ
MPYDEGRQMLVFAATQTQVAGKRPLTDLDGTLWFLHFINESSILPGTTITAQFKVAPEGEAGTISGDAGCNTYNATFAQELGVIASLSSTVICFNPEGVMEQENDYLSALGRAYGYWLTGNQLVINTGLGALTYRQNPPDSSRDQTHLLQNVKWFLVTYNTQPSVSGNAEPFLFLNLDQTFFGNTGCNDLNGIYETNVESINFSQVNVGDNLCPDEASAEQESVTLTNINTSQSFVVANTEMQIASDPGILNYSSTPVQRPDPIEPPTAVINAPSEASVGEIVRFDGSGSTSEIGISNYDWSLGDGNQKSGKNVEHIYVSPGTYEVILTVADKVGQRSTATQPIVINAQPSEQIPPSAAIEGPSNGFVAEPVTFSAEGSTSGSSPINSFSWDFGDGTAAPASPNTSVTTLYEKSGTYTVTVTATDANGLSDSASMEIEIDTRMEGPVWTLHPVLPRTSITMQFLQGRLTGFSGCNTYDGTYIATDNGDGTYLVTINELISTQLSCSEELMEQESEYLEALSAITGASTDGNILILTGEGPDLTFYEVGTAKPELLE